MLSKLRDFFTDKISLEKAAEPVAIDHHIKVATCALMIEMASIDEEFDSAERERIIRLFEKEFGITNDETDELFKLAHQQLDTRIDLWGFTNLINQHYDNEQKTKVIEMIWEVVYADGELSAHEDYLVHKYYKMLNLSHGQMIEAKMRVLNRRNK